MAEQDVMKKWGETKALDRLVETLDLQALGADLEPLIKYLGQCEQAFEPSQLYKGPRGGRGGEGQKFIDTSLRLSGSWLHELLSECYACSLDYICINICVTHAYIYRRVSCYHRHQAVCNR
jgi:hypothetical protein